MDLIRRTYKTNPGPPAQWDGQSAEDLKIEISTHGGHHKYYKILRKDMLHNGVQYDIDVSMCVPGGSFFCTLQDVPWWLDLYEDNELVVEVHFLARSRVVRVGRRKLWTDCFYLRNPVLIPRFIRRYFEPMDILKRSPFLIRYMAEPSLTLQFFAVDCNPHVLQHIEIQNNDVCTFAVQKNGLALRYVKCHTTDMYLIAVKQNGMALAYIEENYWTNKTYEKTMAEICLAAVRKTGIALQFVRKQTTEICEAAVQQDGYALMYVWPALKTLNVCRLAWLQNKRSFEFASDHFKRVWTTPRFKLN